MPHVQQAIAQTHRITKLAQDGQSLLFELACSAVIALVQSECAREIERLGAQNCAGVLRQRQQILEPGSSLTRMGLFKPEFLEQVSQLEPSLRLLVRDQPREECMQVGMFAFEPPRPDSSL